SSSQFRNFLFWHNAVKSTPGTSVYINAPSEHKEVSRKQYLSKATHFRPPLEKNMVRNGRVSKSFGNGPRTNYCSILAFILTLWIASTATGQTFAPAVNYAAGNTPYAVAVGDFNRDGKVDLAVPNFGGNNLSILLGNGNGTFGAPTNFGTGAAPLFTAVADLNGDGKLD